MARPAQRSLLAHAHDGAARVLADCLNLSRGDLVALFWDESTATCAGVLTNVAGELGIEVVDRKVSRADQVENSRRHAIGSEDQSAIDRARAVLICVAAGTETLHYRKALVNTSVDVSRYVGMIPGATLEVLGHAVNIDYAAAQDRCDDLAVAMLLGSEAVLTTSPETVRRRPHTLTLGLGQFRRSPITSTGIISRDTWGNLPGGETFIAPLEGTATGEFLLNGSFTGHVLERGRPLLLRFDAGTLVAVEGVGPGRDALESLIDWPRCSMQEPPLSLAELGIGVNTSISTLTGNPLFDEKMARTAHIAVGDNSIYGGLLQSHLHEDFITRGPSLRIDGQDILVAGNYAFDPAYWRESLASIARMGDGIPDRALMAKRPLHASADRRGRLTVRRDVGAKRKCIYTVGDPESSPVLARFHALLPPVPESISLAILADRWRAASGETRVDVVKGLIGVLVRHELVGITSPDD